MFGGSESLKRIALPRRASVAALQAVTVLALAAGLLGGCKAHKQGPQAARGVLDLRQWNFEKDGPVKLDGQWEFYWKKFRPDIKPDDRPEFIRPGPWNDHPHRGRKIGGIGYATYRLKILLPPESGKLGLYMGEIFTSVRLHAPGARFTVGTPGRTEGETRPVTHRFIAELSSRERSPVLELEAANFTHRRGGMPYVPLLGAVEALRRQVFLARLWQGMLAAAFFLFGLYHIQQHLVRPNRAVFWFGVFCCLVAVRTTQTGATLFGVFVPDLDYRIYLRIEYATLFFMPAPLLMMLHGLFPNEFGRLARNIGIVYFSSYVGTLVLHPQVFSRLLLGWQMGLMVLIGVVVYVILSAVKNRRPESRTFAFAFLALSIGTLIDLVASIAYSAATPFTSFGLFVFIVLQAQVLTRRYAAAFSAVEDLSANLERKVVQRTQELEESRRESESARAEAALLADLARKANDALGLDEIIGVVVQGLQERIGVDTMGLYMPNADGDHLALKSLYIGGKPTDPATSPPAAREISIRAGSGIIARTWNKQKPIYLERIDPNWLKKYPIDAAIAEYLRFTWFVLMPLKSDGKCAGILTFTGPEQRRLSREDIQFFERVGAQAAGAVRSVALLRISEEARAESDRLLENILPTQAALELKREGSVQPLYYGNVSILFTDFVGFTEASAKMQPRELVKELDGCFSQFDEVVKRNGMEKLKTIGDAYMCAAGVPTLSDTHAVDACLTALEFRSFMRTMAEIKRSTGHLFWEIRIGIHSGPVTAGVIGTSKFAYDIWGDSVNTASRMESSGEPDSINISSDTYDLVKNFFVCRHRGQIEVKGKGELDMYFLERIKPELSADDEGILPNERFQMRR